MGKVALNLTCRSTHASVVHKNNAQSSFGPTRPRCITFSLPSYQFSSDFLSSATRTRLNHHFLTLLFQLHHPACHKVSISTSGLTQCPSPLNIRSHTGLSSALHLHHILTLALDVSSKYESMVSHPFLTPQSTSESTKPPNPSPFN